VGQVEHTGAARCLRKPLSQYETEAHMGPKKALWTLIAAAAGMMALSGLRSALNRGWKLAKGADPPENPASSEVTWRDAIAWTIATGVVVELGRLLALRGAAAGWKQVTGETPPL
jgi:hypothetical protein